MLSDSLKVTQLVKGKIRCSLADPEPTLNLTQYV